MSSVPCGMGKREEDIGCLNLRCITLCPKYVSKVKVSESRKLTHERFIDAGKTGRGAWSADRITLGRKPVSEELGKARFAEPTMAKLRRLGARPRRLGQQTVHPQRHWTRFLEL